MMMMKSRGKQGRIQYVRITEISIQHLPVPEEKKMKKMKKMKEWGGGGGEKTSNSDYDFWKNKKKEWNRGERSK